MLNRKIYSFKSYLAEIFRDNLEAKTGARYFNYVILFLIGLSVLGIFLSTYDQLAAEYAFYISLIDYITVTIFTIEVSLRIWCADLLDDKYQGFLGRLRYCLSFYGLMDVLSTYSFYLAFIFPIPPLVVQMLRILRLCRIFRYLKSFSVLSRAIKAKKSEMLVSLEFLCIATLILAFILYFVEHEAQPEVYSNGLTSVTWAFLQYIGDPGQFANTPPITVAGRVVASVIGILTIAIFAVPAGLIASAFTEIMQEDKQIAQYKNFQKRILHAFRFNYDRQYTSLYYCPRYLSFSKILARKFLSNTEIIKAVESSECFHLFDLADASSPSEKPMERLVVVNYKKNRPYGCCIDRNSKITIVSTSGYAEPVTSWFAYHIAKIGGFNYVSKEVETNMDNPISYYLVNNKNACPNFNEFISDISRLSHQPDSWVIPILGAVGESTRSSQFHFCYAPKNSPANIEQSLTTIEDLSLFKTMYQDFKTVMQSQFNFNCDENEYYGVAGKRNIERILQEQGVNNIFTLRIETKLYVFDTKSILYAKTIADMLNKHIEGLENKEVPAEMLKCHSDKSFSLYGYDDGSEFVHIDKMA